MTTKKKIIIAGLAALVIGAFVYRAYKGRKAREKVSQIAADEEKKP